MKGIIFLTLLWPFFAGAQSPEIIKLANEISTTDLRANVYKLSSPGMEGSFTGTRGDSLAAAHIADWFKKYRLVAPYSNSAGYFQAVPLNKMVISGAEISAVGKRFLQFNDWYVFPNSTCKSIQLQSVPVVFGGYGIVSDQYNDLLGEDVQGKIVIIVLVQPADKISDALAKSSRSTISSDFLKNLSEKGAAGVLVVTNDFERSSRSLKVAGALRSFRNPQTVIHPLPRIYVSEKMVNELLQPNDVTLQSLLINMRRTHRPLSFLTKATINISVQLDSVMGQAQNVIGMIKGKDSLADAVIIAAHHDHLGKRGGQFFPGASDNASSNAALLEISKLMQKAAQTGMRPKRTIIFASFTGEEAGGLGSEQYTRYPLVPASKTWACYNLSALGSIDSFHAGKPDSNYCYFLIRDALKHGLHDAMTGSNQSVKLLLDDRYQEPAFPNRWLIGGDAISFYMQGIPVIQTGSGYADKYHQLTDTPDEVNFPLLALQTKLAFLTLWNLASR